MTPTDFLPLLEEELRSRYRPYDRGQLPGFVEATWSLIADDPDPAGGGFLDAAREGVNVA